MGTPLKEPVITTLLSTKYFDVIDVNDGTRPVGEGYKIVKEPKEVNGVVVIPVLPDGRLILASLLRRAIGKVLIEFPRGKIDDEESPCVAGVRELSEEIAMDAISIKQIGKLHSNTSLLSSSVAVCVADVSGLAGSETDGEVDHFMIKTLDEIRAMIREGEITDGHTLSALMMYLSESN
jgi:ADP-ribose pyrophosphatase